MPSVATITRLPFWAAKTSTKNHHHTCHVIATDTSKRLVWQRKRQRNREEGYLTDLIVFVEYLFICKDLEKFQNYVLEGTYVVFIVNCNLNISELF